MKCRSYNTRKALTKSRTDHFAASITYLQFSIQVCFFSHVTRTDF